MATPMAAIPLQEWNGSQQKDTHQIKALTTNNIIHLHTYIHEFLVTMNLQNPCAFQYISVIYYGVLCSFFFFFLICKDTDTPAQKGAE